MAQNQGKKKRAVLWTAIFACLLLLGNFFTVAESNRANAADLSQFNPGNIISDAVFYNGSSMTSAQVQSFLNSKVPNCTINNGQPSHAAGAPWGSTTISDVCLKDYSQPTPNMAAQPGICSAYSGAARESAAAIIAKIGQACNISQKVLLVLLEKEQSLISDSWPTVRQISQATGFACYDNGQPCVQDYAGFFYQVWSAARQFQRYGNAPFTWYPVGQVSNILYQANNPGCGTRAVYIQNRATAALYYYPPYTPNAAALAAGYGTGDSCSAYGNRNFFQLYVDWFGSTQATKLVLTPVPTLSPKPSASVGTSITATPGTWDNGVQIAYQWLRDGVAISGATNASYLLTNSDIGAVVQVKITGSRLGSDSVSQTSTDSVYVGADVSNPSSASMYNPIKPARFADTRSGFSTIDGQSASTGTIGAGQSLRIPVLGRNGIPSSGVSAVSMNVTVVNPSRAGYLSVYPTGTNIPNSSNLNFAAGQTIPNAVISKIGADGSISIFNPAGNVNIIVDINGWFPTGAQFTPIDPARFADTRVGATTIDGILAGAGQVQNGRVIKIPVLGRNGIPASGVGAVSVNVTVVNPSQNGYLTVFPSRQTIPNSSNLNFVSGQTIPNSVISKIGSDGSISIYNPGGALDIVVDINGWFAAN